MKNATRIKRNRILLSLVASLFPLLSSAQVATQTPAPTTLVKARRLLDPRTGNVLSPAEVVKFVQEAIMDGARVIQQQGDAGLDKTSMFFGNRLTHKSAIWMSAIEHSAEHYGQLVVYYRANNLVPPDSRR